MFDTIQTSFTKYDSRLNDSRFNHEMMNIRRWLRFRSNSFDSTKKKDSENKIKKFFSFEYRKIHIKKKFYRFEPFHLIIRVDNISLFTEEYFYEF